MSNNVFFPALSIFSKKKWKEEQRRLEEMLISLRKMEAPQESIEAYFFCLEFLSVVSHFYDKGELKNAPKEKKEVQSKFNRALKVLGRNQYGMNRSEKGHDVTLDSLWLGDVFGLVTMPARSWYKDHEVYTGFCKKFPHEGFIKDPTMAELIAKTQVKGINSSYFEFQNLCCQLLS